MNTSHSSYDDACREAATAQGLDPIMDELSAATIPHGLYQSGGFTMIVTVPTADDTYAWLTTDPDDDGDVPVWISFGHVCHRGGDAYDTCPGCADDDDYVRIVGLDDLPSLFPVCGDCGRSDVAIHPDSDDQRGEPICVRCVAGGAFAP